jgi:hypothetical protein
MHWSAFFIAKLRADLLSFLHLALLEAELSPAWTNVRDRNFGGGTGRTFRFRNTGFRYDAERKQGSDEEVPYHWNTPPNT